MREGSFLVAKAARKEMRVCARVRVVRGCDRNNKILVQLRLKHEHRVLRVKSHF